MCLLSVRRVSLTLKFYSFGGVDSDKYGSTDDIKQKKQKKTKQLLTRPNHKSLKTIQIQCSLVPAEGPGRGIIHKHIDRSYLKSLYVQKWNKYQLLLSYVL